MALMLDNRHVEVTIEKPAGIANFIGMPVGDDFYFIGKVIAPAVSFDVKYKVVLKDPVNCELITPKPAEDTKTTTGGLVTPYKVQFKVNGEKKMGGNIYFLPVDLEIFSGQNSRDAVSEDKEEAKGAFTVANLNDTDGDSIFDNKDIVVKKAANADAGVEDEIDLMKLVVRGPNTGRMKVTIVSGSVEFWEKSTKETPKTKNGNAIFINGSDLPKTLWVEATKHSDTVRDIELRLGWESIDKTLKDNLDTVKATAIWAKKTEVRNLISQTLWDEVNDANIVKNWKVRYGNDHFGIHYRAQPVGISYNIGFQFTVFPSQIGNEANVKFDVTRQAEGKIWSLNTQPPKVRLEGEKTFPNGDLANDNVEDGPDRDNDNTPTNNHLYSIDGPGIPTIITTDEEFIFRANFHEYVRVKIDGQQPTGNVLSGSRCSLKTPWHVRISAINSNGTYEQNSAKPNDVTEGHIAIPNQP